MAHTTIKTAIIIFLATATHTAKNTARPVHEVINEQARVDDKRPLPYTNPLASNSNPKLHAQHQQAMFNAERVRQHRAQSQRWMQIPRIDSYMKAYRESQENHQLALEQMQSNLKPTKTRNEPRTLQSKESKAIQVPELTKITRADAVVSEKNRNQRSYGSAHFTPQKKRKIYIGAGTTYDQGVTIRPNGNNGLNHIEQESKLFTEAVPKTRLVYPKLYGQMHGYRSAEDIQALNHLLSRPAKDQLTEFNALVQNKETQKVLETPMDLYFYLKDPALANEHVYTPYANQYLSNEKPITEDVDDIEDPNKVTKLQAYGVQGVLAPSTDVETTTLKNNYYNIEQTISGNKPNDVPYTTQYAVVQEKPSYEALKYQGPIVFNFKEEMTDHIQEKPSFEAISYEKPSVYHPKEESLKYLHSEPKGVQHLSQDGTGVSAYGDDDIHYAANYEFGYRVRDPQSGNDFGHREEKSGDRTLGHYHVLLPDGRMQQVLYSAGPSGFHADISYDHLQ